jgi:cellulose synthase/poly-beta-1,6-N-acetylglucosamine synthase-like glycosyltransferase
MVIIAAVSFVVLLVVIVPIGYWLLLAIAALRVPEAPVPAARPSTRFVIAIPAHDEDSVIAATVDRLRGLDYPAELFSIHIVADHCSDNTAALARQAGAIVHERNEGPRTGKGAALAWLFERVLGGDCDAVVVFDSDTQVESDFLRLMDVRLTQGAQVIQGQHVIRNPNAGWFPALTWAMFLIDNRFQNLGRSNLGWSAKHMGDSICFRADILRRLGWGEGLTEDYHLRQRLLLAGIRISYEPSAKGHGEAPRTWAQARAQRARWLRGTRMASEQLASQLWAEAIRRRDLALLDGALQAYLPSFSTLTVVSVLVLLAQVLLVSLVGHLMFPAALIYAWAVVCVVLFIYPLFGLALEKAPAKAYLVILTGPLFVIWRTILAITSRYSRRPVVWVRTAHGEPK